MVIKKFVAPTMPEALARVKSELGDQAVILKTRMNRKAGGPGPKGVEVTAAIEASQKSRLEPTPENGIDRLKTSAAEREPVSNRLLPSEKLDHLSEQVEQLNALSKEFNQEAILGQIIELKNLFEQTPISERLTDLAKVIENISSDKQLSGFQEVLTRTMQKYQAPTFFGNLSSELLEIGRELIKKNVTEELALALVSRVARSENALNLTGEEIKSALQQALCSLIPATEPINIVDSGPTLVMFVGPSGSGKTSAIARLAMQHKVENNDEIAIITTDNFRADSSQQIKSFCRIIGCPCGVVYSPEELSIAIKSKDQGLILIDTPGVSPYDEKEIGELQSLIRTAKPHEVHLVVPASTPATDMTNILKAYSGFGIDRVLITKFDETEAPGGVISAVISHGKKLSYISRSREIPGQFGPALAETLAGSLFIEKTVEDIKPEWEMEAVGIWQ
jgi:flagellar biosynthesis protein FlhF